MATLPALNVYADVRKEERGYFADGASLPALGVSASPALDEYGDGYALNADPIPDLSVVLVERVVQFGDWANMNTDPIPDLAPLLVDQGSPAVSTPPFYAIMRGKNTGGGAAWVFWEAENGPDPDGNYYDGAVPFSQLTDIVWAATRHLS